MELSEKDLEAIGLLMEQTIDNAFDSRLEPFRREVNERFDHVFKELETLQREYEFTGEQLKRKDKKLDDHEERITTLEEKVA